MLNDKWLKITRNVMKYRLCRSMKVCDQIKVAILMLLRHWLSIMNPPYPTTATKAKDHRSRWTARIQAKEEERVWRQYPQEPIIHRELDQVHQVGGESAWDRKVDWMGISMNCIFLLQICMYLTPNMCLFALQQMPTFYMYMEKFYTVSIFPYT